MAATASGGRLALPASKWQLLEGVDLPVDIVGESFYMAQIRRLINDELFDSLARRYPHHQQFESTSLFGAQLVREPSNPHDSNAIAAWVRGYQVGHLAAQDAARVAPAMDRAAVRTIEPLQARFVWKIRDDGGRRLRYDELKVGVKLG